MGLSSLVLHNLFEMGDFVECVAQIDIARLRDGSLGIHFAPLSMVLLAKHDAVVRAPSHLYTSSPLMHLPQPNAHPVAPQAHHIDLPGGHIFAEPAPQVPALGPPLMDDPFV